MAKTSDVIMAVAVVAGLGLLIYAGKQLAQWGSGVEKGISNWTSGLEKGITSWESGMSKAAYNVASLGQTPQQIKASGVGAWSWSSAMPNVNFILWGIPQKEETAISSWFSSVEKRLEKGLTTWW